MSSLKRGEYQRVPKSHQGIGQPDRISCSQGYRVNRRFYLRSHPPNMLNGAEEGKERVMAFNAQFQPYGHPVPETSPVSDRPQNPATELESCKAIPASGEVLQCIEQLKFEVMLGKLLTTFINVPASQLDAHILEAQKRICETLGLDRSSLALQTVEGDDMIVTHRWVADGSDDSRPLSTRDIPCLG